MGYVCVWGWMQWRLELEWSQLWTETRGRFRLKTMPLNIVNKGDGFPRIILTEPTGSSAEVGFKIQISINHVLSFLLILIWWPKVNNLIVDIGVANLDRAVIHPMHLSSNPLFHSTIRLYRFVSLEQEKSWQLDHWSMNYMIMGKLMCKLWSATVWYDGNCFRCFCMEGRLFRGRMKDAKNCSLWVAK